MFYHIIGATGNGYTFPRVNFSKDQLLKEYICPFIQKEVVFAGLLYNMGNLISLQVFSTGSPVDSVWPTPQMEPEGNYVEQSYAFRLSEKFREVAIDETFTFFQEALFQIHTGIYVSRKDQVAKSTGENYAFFICPFGNQEVDDNFEFVIRPIVKQNLFTIERADEISHTNYITDVIAKAIAKSKFIVADLTEVRPNCYYEVGYAHALQKPVIILAKEGTERHFDISTYKWIYWKSYRDLKRTFEVEIANIIRQLAAPTPPPFWHA